MRNYSWTLWIVLVAPVVLACGQPSGGPASAAQSETAPTPTADAKKAKLVGLPADNSHCFVCHLNYAQEQFAVAHAQNGVGCVTCHGPSENHSRDDNHIVAPDVMYPPAKVDSMCVTCHRLPQMASIAQHKPEVGRMGLETRVCTDCHAEHRLPHRRRHWDRKSGELVPLTPRESRSTSPVPGKNRR